MMRVVASLFVLLCAAAFTQSKVTTFRVHARSLMEDKFIYIDKFCFDNLGKEDPGHLSWKVHHPNASLVANITLNAYDDEPESWPGLLNNNTISCDNIRLYSKSVIKLSDYMDTQVDVNEGHHHFWYLVIDGCNYIHNELTEYIDITFSWENPGGYFKKQFSFEKQGLLETMMFIVPVLSIVFTIAMYNLVRLIMSRIFHFITRIYYASLLFYTLHIMLQYIHLLVYGSNGFGVFLMDDTSLAFRLIAEVLFIALLFLISSGWLITQAYVRHLNVLAALLVTFMFVYTFLFVWVEIGIHTDTDAEYIFETTPGIVIGVLRLAALLVFVYALRTTIKKENDSAKLKFYKIFGALFVPWFLILPSTILLNFTLPTYVRTKVIEGISMHIEIIYYVTMLVLLWHTQLTKFFGVNTSNSKEIFNFGKEQEQLYDEL